MIKNDAKGVANEKANGSQGVLSEITRKIVKNNNRTTSVSIQDSPGRYKS